MSEIQRQAKEIFLQALELKPDQVPQLLETACKGNSELRMRVEALLDAHQNAGDFLGGDAGENTVIKDFSEENESEERISSASRSSAPQAGTTLGPYKLIKQIGEGGMGSVWLASQSQPIKRTVAIKLIKAGMDSGQVLARFEAERQALAMMDHPNIARVLDAGITEQGRPYFAMEYVKGVPLTAYCDAAKLSVHERLELFLPICQAVQHAHQKGIIHRDLKPTNILVCLYDGKPVPKVIDFGLAKAMHHSLTEQSLYTAHDMMVGTPLYMSPEQAEQNNLDIDTRSDVYAMGVILYELLTGTTPLEKAQMKQAAYGEVLRLIKEVEPPKPSLRLSGSKSLPSVAAQRNIDPAQLTRSITGDLDWVVMKALEKDRNRRYETANGLAEDIRRHLSDEPVSAGPPSTGYRVRKFVRRNRAAVIAGSVISAVLVLGVAGTTSGMLWALAERRDAIEARTAESEAKETAEENASLARQEAERATAAEQQARDTLQDLETEHDAKLQALKEAEQISEFLISILQSPDPSKDGLEVRVIDLLDNAEKKLDTELAELSTQQARLQSTLAATYHALGVQSRAIPLAEKALYTFKTTLGEDDVQTLWTMNDLALYYHHNGLRQKALDLSTKCYAQSRRVLGPQHACTLDAMLHLAFVHFMGGNYEETIRLRKEAIEISTKEYGPDHAETIAIRDSLLSSYFTSGERQKAIAEREQLLDICRQSLGDEHELTLRIMQNLTSNYHVTRQEEKGLRMAQERLRICQEAFSDSDWRTLRSMSGLAIAHYRSGNKAEALAVREKLLSLCLRSLGKTHSQTLTTIQELIRFHDTPDRNLRTQRLREQLLLIQLSRVDAEHAVDKRRMDYLTFSALSVATTQVWQNRRYDYATLLAEVVSLAENSEFPAVLERAAKLASLVADNDQAVQNAAVDYARKAVELGANEASFSPWGRMTLGMALYRAGEFAEADSILAEEKSLAGLTGGTAAFFRAMSLFQLGHRQAALDLFLAAEKKMESLPDEDSLPSGNDSADQVVVWLSYKEARELLKSSESSEQ